MKPDYDAWFFSPLDQQGQKEKRYFESDYQLQAEINNFVAQEAIEDLRLGHIGIADWLIDKVFGGEDEFRKIIVEYLECLDDDDPIYREIKDEYFEHNEVKIVPVDQS